MRTVRTNVAPDAGAIVVPNDGLLRRQQPQSQLHVYMDSRQLGHRLRTMRQLVTLDTEQDQRPRVLDIIVAGVTVLWAGDPYNPYTRLLTPVWG